MIDARLRRFDFAHGEMLSCGFYCHGQRLHRYAGRQLPVTFTGGMSDFKFFESADRCRGQWSRDMARPRADSEAGAHPAPTEAAITEPD
jgi:hypothetical protein